MEYNTSREKLVMPEYGRNVLKMVLLLNNIEDRAKRSEQAAAIVKVMERLNPQVRQQEDYAHKLWDHLFIISDYTLDIDSPYPCPVKEEFETKPVPIPMKGTKIRAAHYGRNIEKIIDLVSEEPEGDMKFSLYRALATYMRTQYLIWNKDYVADETIFSDIEKLSGGKLLAPEGMELSKIPQNASYDRPGLGVQGGSSKKRKGGNRSKRR